MTWQGMETAPMDGTQILGFANGEMSVVQYKFGYWSLVVCGWYAQDSEWTPTHWMPAPAPPQSRE